MTDDARTKFERKLRELDAKALAVAIEAAERGESETVKWLEECGRTVDDLREELRRFRRASASGDG